MTTKKPKAKIGLEIDQEESDLLRWYAERKGHTISSYIRDLLERSIPASFRATWKKGDHRPSVLEMAYQEIDREEERALSPLYSLPEGGSTFRPPPAEAPRPNPLPKVIAGIHHPCGHLSKEPTIDKQVASGGVCRHPKENGRDCCWAAPIAKHCMLFSAKSA